MDLKAMGLVSGQMRCPENVAHNGGWYNSIGYQIGWGDLDEKDALRIRDCLCPGDYFFVLGESDSCWMCMQRGFDEVNPGIDYVLAYARWVICQAGIFYLARDKEEKVRLLEGKIFGGAMTREEFRRGFKTCVQRKM